MGSKRIKKGKDGAELNSPNECMRNVPYKFRNNFKRERERERKKRGAYFSNQKRRWCTDSRHRGRWTFTFPSGKSDKFFCLIIKRGLQPFLSFFLSLVLLSIWLLLLHHPSKRSLGLSLSRCMNQFVPIRWYKSQSEEEGRKALRLE